MKKSFSQLVTSIYFSILLYYRSLLFLQVDNRPCSQVPFSCFPYASEAADFLNAMLDRAPAHIKPEIQALIIIRGINKEITVTESSIKDHDGMFDQTI